MTEPRQLRQIFGLGRYESSAEDKTHRWPELLGVELELEGMRPDEAPSYTMWDKHEDGSLRNGTEYTFAGPLAGKNIDLALNSFYRVPMNWGKGARTSTHIHINMADTTDQHLRMMFLLVYTIEDAIFAATEEGRKWAGYSVPLNEMAPDRMRAILNPFNDDVFVANVSPARNAERYYGFNVGSLRRHGTVEFRYFPGGPSREELESWMDLVTATKKATADMTLETMVEAFSTEERAADFLRTRLGPWGNRLIAARGISEMLMRFAEVAPLAGDADNRHAFGQVYSINPLYFDLLKKHTLRDDLKAIAMLEKYKDITPVHTAADWQSYLEQAIYTIPPNKHPGAGKGKKKTGLEEALAVEASDPFEHPEPPEGWDEPDWAEPPDEYEPLQPTERSPSAAEESESQPNDTAWMFVSVQNDNGTRTIFRERRFRDRVPERTRVTDYAEYLEARRDLNQMPDRWRGDWYGPMHSSSRATPSPPTQARLNPSVNSGVTLSTSEPNFYVGDNATSGWTTTTYAPRGQGLRFSQPESPPTGSSEAPAFLEQESNSLSEIARRMDELIASRPTITPPPNTAEEAIDQVSGGDRDERARRIAQALGRIERLAGEDWSHYWERVRNEASNPDW